MLDTYYSIIQSFFLNNYLYFPLFIMTSLYLSIFWLMGYTLVQNIIYFKKNKTIKEVIIIRGVPGSGKNCLIYDLEYDNNSNFSIISFNDFFIKDGTYKFDRTLINKAYSYSFQKFINCLQINIPKIYINNINNNKWMYNNYIILAQIYNYKVKIIEILCDDQNYLYYFNKRSKHNTPMNYSKNIYNNWDYDENANYIEPYLGNFKGPLLGDSIPSYPPTTKEQLDIELDEYKSKISNNNQNIINNNNTYNNKAYNKNMYETNEIINFLIKKDIFKINHRKIEPEKIINKLYKLKY